MKLRNQILLSLFVLVCIQLGCDWLYHKGFDTGYEQGRKNTNLWFNDQRSVYKDTREVLEKSRREGWDNV